MAIIRNMATAVYSALYLGICLSPVAFAYWSRSDEWADFFESATRFLGL